MCEPSSGTIRGGSSQARTEKNAGATVVLGVGNLLREDDGVGVHVAHALMARNDVGAVTVLDGGVAPFDALSGVGPIERLVIVDAADLGEPPGTIRILSPEQVVARAGKSVSLHDLDLAWALSVLAATGQAPDQTIIVGVQPESLGWRTELSAALKARFDDIVEAVIAEISSPKTEREKVRA